MVKASLKSVLFTSDLTLSLGIEELLRKLALMWFLYVDQYI